MQQAATAPDLTNWAAFQQIFPQISSAHDGDDDDCDDDDDDCNDDCDDYDDDDDYGDDGDYGSEFQRSAMKMMERHRW